MHITRSLRRLGVLLCVATVAASSPAAGTTPRRVTLVQAHANVGIGEDVFLYAVPKHLGYFDQEGLDVSVHGVAGSAVAAQVLQSGSAQFGTTLPEVLVSVRAKGGDLRSVVALSKGLFWQIAVPETSAIRDIAQLKGKSVGVQSLGSGVVPLLALSFAQAGLQTRDVNVLAVGTGPQAAGAFSAGQVDALALWSLDYARLENSGLKLRYIDLPMNHKGAGLVLATSDSLTRSEPAVVTGFCRAIAKAERFTRANPEAAVRIFYQVFPQARPKGVPEQTAVREDVHVLRKWLSNGSGGDTTLQFGQHQSAQWDYSIRQAQQQFHLAKVGTSADYVDNRFIDGCNAFDHDAIERAARAWRPAP